MNLTQLRSICEIARCKLNISLAAKSLGTSQPAISKQLRLLEEELGVPIFLRSRNGLKGITPQGEAILERAKHVLAEVASLHGVAHIHAPVDVTKIRIASAHAQAQYILPRVIGRFRVKYPGVCVYISQKHDEQSALWAMVQNGEVDLAITTDVRDLPRSLLALECYPIQRSLIVPKGHSLLNKRTLTLENIAQYPLVTYGERSNGRRRLMQAFSALGFTPKITVSAVDEEIVKTCIEEGLGISILASIVYQPNRDTRLRARDVTSLLEPSMMNVVVRCSMAHHEYIADFIESFAPQWTRINIAAALMAAKEHIKHRLKPVSPMES